MSDEELQKKKKSTTTPRNKKEKAPEEVVKETGGPAEVHTAEDILASDATARAMVEEAEIHASEKEAASEEKKEIENASEEKEETIASEEKEESAEEEHVSSEGKNENKNASEVKEETTASKEENAEEEEEEVASSDDEDEDEEDAGKDEKEYHSLTEKQLISEFKSLLNNKPVQEIKNDVEEIKSEFNSRFNEELEQKKEDFLAEGGNIIDFHYSTPLKKEFSSLYFDYKEKRNDYYKSLKRDLHANLAKRQELIEELKGLLNAEENINTTYKHFKDIQERWHVAGPIPRDKYNIVWNTYHHHVENFYDFLHLNREFRDLDFKHNLEQKLKLIVRAEELAQEANTNKAFRELQMLHKMWKEEIGPVAKEYREEVWDKFSAATKLIHDKRQEYLQEIEKDFEVNYEVKMKLVNEIKEITSATKPSHQAWQQSIKKVQLLRDTYFEAGKVPRHCTKEVWNAFKEATRVFNKEKNAFYKNQKKEQYTNLEKKRELIKVAEDNKDSDEFETITPLMKRIQDEWKHIGHVPRKESDKIWKQFKEACNHYFNRLHAEKDEANKEELAHFETKKALLDSLNTMEMTGDNKADLKVIKEKIKAWKEIGRVPYNKRSIDRKFNKILDGLFEKLDLSKKETELIKFDNKVNAFVSQEDERKLQNEHFFISKKIGETRDEIRQLENNLGFFQHADSDNPLVKEVHKNIARHKEQLEVWKAKLEKIKSVRNE